MFKRFFLAINNWFDKQRHSEVEIHLRKYEKWRKKGTSSFNWEYHFPNGESYCFYECTHLMDKISNGRPLLLFNLTPPKTIIDQHWPDIFKIFDKCIEPKKYKRFMDV
ncbi:MAG: hypothetical protein ACHQ1D_01495 [Nitrososphaerales archaeon]